MKKKILLIAIIMVLFIPKVSAKTEEDYGAYHYSCPSGYELTKYSGSEERVCVKKMGEAEHTCKQGTYNKSQDSCILYNEICTRGGTYNYTKKKCTYSSVGNNCKKNGANYNMITRNCEYVPTCAGKIIGGQKCEVSSKIYLEYTCSKYSALVVGLFEQNGNCYSKQAPTKTSRDYSISPASKDCSSACSSSYTYQYAVSSCVSTCISSCGSSKNISKCAEKFKKSESSNSTSTKTTDNTTSTSTDNSTSSTTNSGDNESTVLVKEIKLNKKTLMIGKDQDYKLKATVKPSDASNSSVKWTSSDNNIATVNKNGKVTGKKKGTVIITASAKDSSGVKAKCEVTITDKTKVKELSMAKSISLKVGKEKTIKVTISPSNASDKGLKWESSNDKVVSVSNKGVIKGLKEGKATITATAQDGTKVKAKTEVTVSIIEQIKFKKGESSVRIEEVGKTHTLKYTYDKDQKVVFESTNNSIATVSKKGKVTSKAIGTTTIIAYYEGDKSSQVESKIFVGKLATGLSSEKSNYSIKPGEQLQLNIKITPENVSKTILRYVSTDPTVATVNGSGLVTAIKEGTTTITVNTRDGSRKTTYAVITVSNTGALDNTNLSKVKDITLSDKVVKLDIGKKKKVKIKKNPSKIPKKDLEWFSRNENVAIVNKDGLITAVDSGQTAVYLMYNGGSKTGAKRIVALVRVDVNFIKLKSFSLNPSKKTLKPNDTVQLALGKYEPANATRLTFTWTSSNSKVATVDNKGLVTAVGLGKATIYAVAKDGSRTTGTTTIIVNETGKEDEIVKASSITLNKTSASISKKGSVTLKVKFNPNTVTNKNVTWKSSDEKIATVNNKGKVKGKKNGTVTITATTKDGSNKTATCQVTVTNKVKVTSITMDQTLKIKVKEKEKLKVKFNPTDATNKKLKWTSSDKSVAVVSKKGIVTGKKKGTAVITAITQDGTKQTAMCKVTVSNKKDNKSVDHKKYKKKHQVSKLIEKRIFLGDSRTEGMLGAVGQKKNEVWKAKTGMGYDWMVNTAVPAIQSELKDGTAVIFLFGVNDLGNANSYANKINEYANAWKPIGVKVYFVSVNPVDDSKPSNARNNLITDFNNIMKSKLNSNVTYIDTNSQLGFDTSADNMGVHYSKQTYQSIYQYIVNIVK